jgi:hypothetical protein
LNAEPTSDWSPAQTDWSPAQTGWSSTATDWSTGETDWSTAADASFDQVVEGGPAAAPEDPLDEMCLMAFLSDFRSAHHAPAATPDGLEATAPSHRPAGHQSAGHYLGAAKQEPAAYIDDPYLGSPEKVSDDWWLASDGRWYAPELHPDVQMAAAGLPEDPVTFTEPESPVGHVQPDVTGRTARRPKLRGRLRSPVAV